jgi:hypothetical protein
MLNMVRQQRWSVSFRSTETLRDEERAAEQGGDPCSRDIFCSGRRIVAGNGERKVVPARTYGHFCASCQGLIASCLSELPPAYVRLRREIGEASSQHAGVRTPFGPRLPLRADVDELMRSIAEVLMSWNERVREVARLSALDTQLSRRRDQAAAVAGSARLLGAHLNVLLALEAGPMVRAVRVHSAPDEIAVLDLSGRDAGEEVLQLHRSALLVLGEIVKRRETLDGIPCKMCECMSLERAEPPSDPSKEAMWSRCDECGHLMSRADFEAWAAWYARWAGRAQPACRRCELGRHDECDPLYACPCATGGHAAALSVA